MGKVGAREVTEYQIYRRHRWHCFYKIKFDSESSAQEALHALVDSGNSYLIKELTVYVCQHCHYLHIGHVPRWKEDGQDEKQRLGPSGEKTRWTRGLELRAAKEARDRERGSVASVFKSVHTGRASNQSSDSFVPDGGASPQTN